MSIKKISIAIALAILSGGARAEGPRPKAAPATGSFLIEKLNDPNVLAQAEAVPFKDSKGTVTGFKILSLVPGSVYEDLGLQPGDVIQAVNGQPMTTLTAAQDLYARAGSPDGVRIAILRNGKRIERTFKATRGEASGRAVTSDSDARIEKNGTSATTGKGAAQ